MHIHTDKYVKRSYILNKKSTLSLKISIIRLIFTAEFISNELL